MTKLHAPSAKASAHDGRTIFPMMPYEAYRTISDEDVASIVVYLRSIAPVRNPLPPTKVDFPVNYLIRTVPQPLTSAVSGPSPQASPAERGKYLVTVGCGCHIATDRKGPIRRPGVWWRRAPGGTVGRRHQRQYHSRPFRNQLLRRGHFHQVMRTGYVKARKLSSIMPFGEFANLTDDDLKAIFAYLRTCRP